MGSGVGVGTAGAWQAERGPDQPEAISTRPTAATPSPTSCARLIRSWSTCHAEDHRHGRRERGHRRDLDGQAPSDRHEQQRGGDRVEHPRPDRQGPAVPVGEGRSAPRRARTASSPPTSTTADTRAESAGQLPEAEDVLANMMKEVPSRAPENIATAIWARLPGWSSSPSSRPEQRAGDDRARHADEHDDRRPLALDQPPRHRHHRAHNRGDRRDDRHPTGAEAVVQQAEPGHVARAGDSAVDEVAAGHLGAHRHCDDGDPDQGRELRDEQHSGGRGPLRGAPAEEVPRSERGRDEQPEHHRHPAEPTKRT